MVEARQPGDAAHPAIAPAPGTYVTEVPSAESRPLLNNTGAG
jgi:hypothetical protein